MRCTDVLGLTRIIGDVVQLVAIDEAPGILHDAAVPPFERMRDALRVGGDYAFCPV